MLLAFGGLKGRLDVPPFEFFALTKEMAVKRLFIRDLHQAWYHRGLVGHTPTILGTVRVLSNLIAVEGVERLVVAGTSAGGYAALLFGTLLRAETVLSFCPQTTLDPTHLKEMKDFRWEERPRKLFEAGCLETNWLDLREALPTVHAPNTHCKIFFDEHYEPDRLHAEHVGVVNGVELHPRHGSEHLVARQMRENGELERVLHTALDLPDTGG